jgi:hypothetical protein
MFKNVFKCPGCQRINCSFKLCPAWGTELYYSGKLFTEEDEKNPKYKAQREEALKKLKDVDYSYLD